MTRILYLLAAVPWLALFTIQVKDSRWFTYSDRLLELVVDLESKGVSILPTNLQPLMDRNFAPAFAVSAYRKLNEAHLVESDDAAYDTNLAIAGGDLIQISQSHPALVRKTIWLDVIRRSGNGKTEKEIAAETWRRIMDLALLNVIEQAVTVDLDKHVENFTDKLRDRDAYQVADPEEQIKKIGPVFRAMETMFFATVKS